MSDTSSDVKYLNATEQLELMDATDDYEAFSNGLTSARLGDEGFVHKTALKPAGYVISEPSDLLTKFHKELPEPVLLANNFKEAGAGPETPAPQPPEQTSDIDKTAKIDSLMQPKPPGSSEDISS